MKNTLLVLALAFVATFSAQAQDSLATSTSGFKPTAGYKTAEVGLSLGSGTYLNGGQLRFRKFKTDTEAIRLGISADVDNISIDNIKATYAAIAVTPGVERHFAGTRRLSPYIGAELPLSYAYSRYEDQNRTITGAWDEGNQNRAHIGIGVNALAGVDLYLIKNLYVGFEFGAGIAYQRDQRVEIDHKEDFYEDNTTKARNNISFDTFSSGGLRLGFVF